MKSYWWKILSVILVFYSFTAGLLNDVPRLPILNETIRNLYFHVPMWFGMTFLLLISAYFSVRYLGKGEAKFDFYAIESANTGIVFGVLGLLTGMVWARFTWGAFWVGDPKLNSAAIGLLIYFALIILRNSLQDEQQKARVSAVFNIFSFPVFLSLIYILPRLTDSLHPGNGGNPGFNSYDLNNQMRWIFYPSVLGFILVGVWITTIRVRYRLIKKQLSDDV